jgi:hypothetical protein
MGNLEKANSLFSISAPPVHGQKKKQLKLLSQCKLAFTGRNLLMALKIRMRIKKYKKKLCGDAFLSSIFEGHGQSTDPPPPLS